MIPSCGGDIRQKKSGVGGTFGGEDKTVVLALTIILNQMCVLGQSGHSEPDGRQYHVTEFLFTIKSL